MKIRSVRSGACARIERNPYVVVSCCRCSSDNRGRKSVKSSDSVGDDATISAPVASTTPGQPMGCSQLWLQSSPCARNSMAVALASLSEPTQWWFVSTWPSQPKSQPVQKIEPLALWTSSRATARDAANSVVSYCTHATRSEPSEPSTHCDGGSPLALPVAELLVASSQLPPLNVVTGPTCLSVSLRESVSVLDGGVSTL
jgi:hypothetical protein